MQVGNFYLEVFSLEPGFQDKRIIEYGSKIGSLQNEPFYFVLKNNNYNDYKAVFLDETFEIKAYSSFCSKDLFRLNFDDKKLNNFISIDILNVGIVNLNFLNWVDLRRELRSTSKDKRKEFKRL